MGADQVTGDLDKAIIRRYIRRSMPRIRFCYEKQLQVDPNLRGTITVQFIINPVGQVLRSVGSGFDKKVADCVAAAIQAIQFPKPKGAGLVMVRYPFHFTPGQGWRPEPSPRALYKEGTIGQFEGNSEAITVSSIRLIWLTDTPNSAGNISHRMRFTPGWEKSTRGRGSKPRGRKNGN